MEGTSKNAPAAKSLTLERWFIPVTKSEAEAKTAAEAASAPRIPPVEPKKKKKKKTPAMRAQSPSSVRVPIRKRGFLAAASDVPLIKATSQRTSRQARPAEPSAKAVKAALEKVRSAQRQLASAGIALPRVAVVREGRPSGSTAKGSMAAAAGGSCDAVRPHVTHLAGLKSRAASRDDDLPCFYTGAQDDWPSTSKDTVEKRTWANSLNCALTNRSPTQGGAIQIRGRINLGCIERAEHAQIEAVTVVVALARLLALSEGVGVAANSLGTCAPSPFLMHQVARGGAMFVLPSTTLSSEHSRASKLGVGSVVSVARALATGERDEQLISNRMLCTGREALGQLCGAVLAPGGSCDPVWASIVLVVFLTSHPRLRVLLSEDRLQLTPFDLAVAAALEFYGRTELVRRSRLDRRRAKGSEVFEPSNVREARREAGRKRALEELREQDAASEEREDGDVCERRRVLLGQTPATPSSIFGSARSTSASVDDFLPEEEGEMDDEEMEAQLEEEMLTQMEADSANEDAEEVDGSGVGGAAVAGGDPRAMLEFWATRLSSGRHHDAVLRALVSVSCRSAREAANSVLEVQAREPGLAQNRVLQQLAQTTSERSAHEMSRMLGRRAEDAPRAVAENVNLCGGASAPTLVKVAIQESLQPALEGALFCMRVAAPEMQPSGAVISHAVASRKLSPREEDHSVFPCVLERTRQLAKLKRSAAKETGRGFERLSGKQEREAARLRDHVDRNSYEPVLCDAAGTVRSLMVVESVVKASADQINAAGGLAADFALVYAAATRGQPTPAQTPESRKEPRSQQAGRVAVALRATAHTVRMFQTKSRRGRACKAWVGPECAADTRVSAKETPPVADNDPPPILAIMDASVDFLAHAPTALDALRSPPRVVELKARHQLLVCCDGLVRVPEAMELLRLKALSLPGPPVVNTDYFAARIALPPARRVLADADPACAIQAVREITALVLAGASQTSLIECYASSMGATALNSQVNQSKRPSVADNTTALHLTPFSAYVGGLANLKQSFPGTAWAGSHGPRLDSGVGSPGLLCKNVTSDGRQHGTLLLSQTEADALLDAVSDEFFVKGQSGQSAYARPVDTRGIPHGLSVGVHAGLDHLRDALNRLDGVTGSCDRDVRTTVLALPLARYTQSLAPFADPLADISQRANVWASKDHEALLEGRAYLPDATAEEDAIVCEPHFNRPNQASFGSNFSATGCENASVLLSASAALALLARELLALSQGGLNEKPASVQEARSRAEAAVLCLHKALSDWHDGLIDQRVAPCACLLPAAAVLLNCCFPTSWAVAEPILIEAYALAPAACARRVRRAAARGSHASEECSLPSLMRKHPVELAEAQRFFAAFRRAENSAWPAFAELMVTQLVEDGRFDATTADSVAFRHKLVAAAQAAWLVHSPDGIARPPSGPASEVASAKQLANPQFAPIFFCTENTDARGGLIGMLRFQFRQVLALLLGCEVSLGQARVKVQVYRNEGSLVSRTCAAADLAKSDGSKRAAKGASALQTDNDTFGFGAIEAKLIGSMRQRSAFDKNAALCRLLFARLSTPAAKDERWRGSLVDSRKPDRLESAEQPRTEEAIASALLIEKASVSPLTEAVLQLENEIVKGARSA